MRNIKSNRPTLTRSEVLILSRTRMSAGKVCVGGHCLSTRKNVRLLTSHWGRLSESEPYRIGEVYQVAYYTESTPVSFHPIVAPHIEDVAVSQKNKLRILSNTDFKTVINRLSISNVHIRDLFEGCLNWENGKGFLLKESIPSCGSVQIARLSHDLVMSESRYGDKVSTIYELKTPFGKGYTASYVGYESLNLPLIIRANTPVRFSLARFWDKGDQIERSYLQLSGFYL